MMKRLLNNSFLRSSFIFTAANLLVSVIAYVDNLLVARYLTLTEYGEYTTALSYLIFFSVPLTAFGLIVVARIGRESSERRPSIALSIERWLETELWTFAPALLLLVSVVAVLMYFKGNMSIMAVAFVIASSIIGIFTSFYSSVLQSYKTFWSVGIFSIVSAFIKLALFVLVVVIRPELFWLFVGFILSYVLSYFIGRKMIRKKTSYQVKNLQFAQLRKYLRRKSILIPLFTTLGIVGLSNVDVILVKKFFDGDLVGLYASLSLLGKIIFFAVSPLSTVGYTFFTGSDTKHQSLPILLLLTVGIIVVGFGMTFFYSLFPSFVIQVVFAKSRFLQVQDLVWLAALFGTMYSLMYLYSQYFVAQKSRFAILGILAVIVQVITIFAVHHSLRDVLVINIVVNSLLALVYVGEVIRRFIISKRSVT